MMNMAKNYTGRTSAENLVWTLFVRSCDPHMDGFYQFEQKKELLRMRHLIDKLLPQTPTFVGEEEFMKELQDGHSS